MGFFDGNMSKEEREEQYKRETLEKNDVFKGVECELILPEKQLRTQGSSGAKKGVATLAFGIVGWAATSGSSQNEENRIITTIFQIVEKGIVFKNGSMDGSDIRIPYEDIVSVEKIENKDKIIGSIILLKNKKIFFNPTKCSSTAAGHIIDQYVNILNKYVCGAIYEEDGWGLENTTFQSAEFTEQRKIDNLERIGNMLEKGLLTDDEFNSLKEKIMKESSKKDNICKNCGTEFSKDSLFCGECGSKIE